MGDKWFVRGVPEDVAQAVADAARTEGITMGRWVTRALRAALERPGPAGAPEAGAEQITEVLERLERLGATLATVEATVTLHDAYIRELRQDRERGRTAGRASPAAARPAPATAAGDGTGARPRGKGGKPLSPEQDKIIADMIRAERPYSEIASKAGVSIGAITKIRKRLGV